MGVTIRIEGFNAQKTIDRIVNDSVGTFMAETTAKHMRKYVPEDAGILATSYITRPFEIEYTQPYAHYMFEGEVYGPNYPIISDGVVTGWYSPSKKFPTGKKIKYTKPLAQSHWDVPTQKNQSRKIASEVTGYLKRL